MNVRKSRNQEFYTYLDIKEEHGFIEIKDSQIKAVAKSILLQIKEAYNFLEIAVPQFCGLTSFFDGIQNDDIEIEEEERETITEALKEIINQLKERDKQLAWEIYQEINAKKNIFQRLSYRKRSIEVEKAIKNYYENMDSNSIQGIRFYCGIYECLKFLIEGIETMPTYMKIYSEWKEKTLSLFEELADEKEIINQKEKNILKDEKQKLDKCKFILDDHIISPYEKYIKSEKEDHDLIMEKEMIKTKLLTGEAEDLKKLKKSIDSIADLQSAICRHIEMQSLKISRITADAINTLENVGESKKELKTAAKSTDKLYKIGSIIIMVLTLLLLAIEYRD